MSEPTPNPRASPANCRAWPMPIHTARFWPMSSMKVKYLPAVGARPSIKYRGVNQRKVQKKTVRARVSERFASSAC